MGAGSDILELKACIHPAWKTLCEEILVKGSFCWCSISDWMQQFLLNWISLNQNLKYILHVALFFHFTCTKTSVQSFCLAPKNAPKSPTACGNISVSLGVFASDEQLPRCLSRSVIITHVLLLKFIWLLSVYRRLLTRHKRLIYFAAFKCVFVCLFTSTSYCRTSCRRHSSRAWS